MQASDRIKGAIFFVLLLCFFVLPASAHALGCAPAELDFDILLFSFFNKNMESVTSK
jgi:hypothetical protein